MPFSSSYSATNVVTDRVSIRAEARSHDPRFRKRIVKEMEKAFRNAVRQVTSHQGRRGKVHFEGQLDYESFLLAEDEPCVQAAEVAIREVGLNPVRAVANGGAQGSGGGRGRGPRGLSEG